jgi:hypothetical protein
MNRKKIRKIVVVVVASLAISGAGFTSSALYAKSPSPGQTGSTPPPQGLIGNPSRVSAPEIDAGAGGYALAFLTGMMLLVSERTRRRSQ